MWIVIVVIVVVVLLLAIGGAVARSRRDVAQTPEFKASLAAVNEDLARAHAEDKGWARAELERAVQEAFAAQQPDAQIEEIHLIQVIDPPGVEDDQAVFTVRADGRERELVLGRSAAGDWHLDRLS